MVVAVSAARFLRESRFSSFKKTFLIPRICITIGFMEILYFSKTDQMCKVNIFIMTFGLTVIYTYSKGALAQNYTFLGLRDF